MIEEGIINVCLKHGAFKAHMLSVNNIPFDEELCAYCEANHCGYYGKNYACPPLVGEVNDLIDEAKSYKSILVYQTISKLTDSFDIEGMENAQRVHSEIADKIGNEIVLHFE